MDLTLTKSLTKLNLHQDLLVLKFLKRVKLLAKYKGVLVTFRAYLLLGALMLSEREHNNLP